MAAVADTDTSRNGANHGSDAREKLNEQFSGLMSAIAGRVGSGADSLTDKLSDLGSGGGRRQERRHGGAGQGR